MSAVKQLIRACSFCTCHIILVRALLVKSNFWPNYCNNDLLPVSAEFNFLV